MKKLLLLLLLIPNLIMAAAIDLEGYYITVKGGASKTFNTGITGPNNFRGFFGGTFFTLPIEDLATGTAFGFSAGKYLNDNFRLELEAIKRTGYEYDARLDAAPIFTEKAKIQTEALFINGFYDFQPFSINNTPITRYLGGGVGFSRNKTGTTVQHI